LFFLFPFQCIGYLTISVGLTNSGS
jgi:hypothetical protein